MTQPDTDQGICILSFDNSGPGSYSQLLLVKKYMRRIELVANEKNVHPSDYFDLMGGVGFGGLAIFMLGCLKMTVDQAMLAVSEIASAIFPDNPTEQPSPDANTQKLKVAIENMLKARKIPLSTKMHDSQRPTQKCKVALYAATPTRIGIFRTYPPPRKGLNPTIVEALCATIANPAHFSPVKIGRPGAEEHFSGGALGSQNPTGELLKEAMAAYGGDQRVAQIISFGAGRVATLSLDSMEPTKRASYLINSLFNDSEVTAATLATRLFNIDAYTRLNVLGGTETHRFNDWSRLSSIKRATEAYVETAAFSRIFEPSVKHLCSRAGIITLRQINCLSTVKVSAKVAPAVSSHYVVRQNEWNIILHHLENSLSPTQRILCITGMAGCGKTQMVSYFLQEKGSRYKGVVFVDASSYSTLKTDLACWAQSLGAGHEQDVWETAIQILETKIYNGQWILILDNANDPNLDLLPFFPRCDHGTIVITSRNRDIGDLSNTHHLALGEMTIDEALSTLLNAAKRQPPLLSAELNAAHRLGELLGHLAIALVQAGTYCHEMSTPNQSFSFEQYIATFSLHRTQLMKTAQSFSLDDYKLAAYVGFDISYNSLPDPAKDIIRFISPFHHSYISLAMLAQAAENSFSDPIELLPRPSDHDAVRVELMTLLCVDGKWDESRVHKFIFALRSFSLVSASSLDGTVFLHIHPLVQAWAKDILPTSLVRHHSMALQVITSCSSRNNLPYRYLLPHLQHLLNDAVADVLHVNDRFAAGCIFVDQAHYHEAEGLFNDIIEVLQDTRGSDDVGAMRVSGILAATYCAHGKWIDAESLQAESLEQHRKVMGDDHLGTMMMKANLAHIYEYQGRYKEAEELEGEVLQYQHEELGMYHPDTIKAAGHLAHTYTSQGRYTDAEALLTTGLEEGQNISGNDQADTVKAALNLANTYYYQGRYSEAEKLQVDVLVQQKRVLGMDHPETLNTAVHLSDSYVSQGRYKEAEDLQLDTLERQKRLLGEEHPDTITTMAHLASTWDYLSRNKEAEELLQNVLERQRRILGENHPETVGTEANLALMYRARGLYKEAEELQVKVMGKQEMSLGQQHPDTIAAAVNLSLTYREQHRDKEAEELQMRALQRQRDVLGLNHPAALNTARFLAATYISQCRYEEAEKLQKEVLEEQTIILGKDHSDTIKTTKDLALTYQSLGRYKEAQELQEQVLSQASTVLGKDHPTTAQARADLAVSYGFLGCYDKAKEYGVQALQQQKALFGSEHAHTVRTAGNLAAAYCFLGDYKEAEDLQWDVLQHQRRLHSKEDPDAIQGLISLGITYGKQEDWEKASSVLFEAVGISLGSLGKENPISRHCVQFLAATLGHLGMKDEAEDILDMLK